MKGDALRDIASERPRPFPQSAKDRQEGLIAIAVLLCLWIAYGVWHERHEGPRHERNIQATLREAGFHDVELRRSWLSGCGRGHKGYTWRAGAAAGWACSYGEAPRASIQVTGRR